MIVRNQLPLIIGAMFKPNILSRCNRVMPRWLVRHG